MHTDPLLPTADAHRTTLREARRAVALGVALAVTIGGSGALMASPAQAGPTLYAAAAQCRQST